MLNQFLLDIKLHKKDYLLPLIVIPACFLLGVGLCSLIMFTVEDPGTWATCGTFLAWISLFFFAVMNFAKYQQEFMLALSMGRTRGAFLVSYALRMLLEMIIGYSLVLVLYQLEMALGNQLYAPWPMELGFEFVADWRMIAIVLPASVIVAMFIGELYSWFGKKVLAVLWVIWMALCLVGPRLMETEGNADVVAKFLQAVPGWGWIVTGVVAAIAMVATVIGLGKKQMVK